MLYIYIYSMHIVLSSRAGCLLFNIYIYEEVVEMLKRRPTLELKTLHHVLDLAILDHFFDELSLD
jgi:hypothetical protein